MFHLRNILALSTELWILLVRLVVIAIISLSVILWNVQRDPVVPTELSRRKQQDEVKSMVGRAHFIDAPQPSSSQVQDDVTGVSGFFSLTRNDDSKLPACSSRKVIATSVTILVKAQSDLAFMIGRYIASELLSVSEKLNRGVVAMKHVLQNLHSVPIQTTICWDVHA
jgi:hypothetical protein